MGRERPLGQCNEDGTWVFFSVTPFIPKIPVLKKIFINRDERDKNNLIENTLLIQYNINLYIINSKNF